MRSIVTMNRVGITEGFIGNPGEITFHDQTMELRFHDGVTPNGFLLTNASNADLMQVIASTLINNTALGNPNGVATLDLNGKIPASQLPDSLSMNGVIINEDGSQTTIKMKLDGGFF